jgi:putative Mg2+ transporter-C (MgtC) family protein
MALQHLDIPIIQQQLIGDSTIRRLLAACLLGGAIGFEREIHGKASGLRTNAFICMGAAFFTLLSPIVAGVDSSNKGQIASNIVQGIGFLGAGLILHYRNRVSGLTSAATVFVVASIGMACGAGLYVPAVFATAIVLAALVFIGLWELQHNVKLYPQVYELRGTDANALVTAAVFVLDKEKRRFILVDSTPLAGVQRVVFGTTAKKREHDRILLDLKSQPGVLNALAYQEEDEE